jgi:glycosyltransferase involved in cell wall biosynthesis
LLRQPQGQAGRLRIEPVRLSFDDGRWQYRYAHAWTQALLGIAPDGAPDHVVDIQAGDILFGADYAPAAVTAAAREGLYDGWRARGISVQFQVFDLLPVLQPQFFPPGADHVHGAWLDAIGAAAHQLICISEAVAQDLRRWLQQRAAIRLPAVRTLHLGADFDGAAVQAAPPSRVQTGRPVFLMVGTIEPRKGHWQALAAFELLWERGIDIGLTIVGGEGWKGLAQAERRTIPRIVAALARLQKAHPQRLRWLQGIDDAALEQLYVDSSCLLAPSEGEGFGLPLIEAARHGLPVLARALPVFREVGGEQISYFEGTDGAALADAIMGWLAAHADGRVDGAALPWLSWDSHAARLLPLIQEGA